MRLIPTADSRSAAAGARLNIPAGEDKGRKWNPRELELSMNAQVGTRYVMVIVHQLTHTVTHTHEREASERRRPPVTAGEGF